MIKKTILLLALTFISVTSHAEVNTCSLENSEIQIQSAELSNLLNILKNDVLGSIPLFCRDNGSPEQLSEQSDEGESSLNQFVKKLAKLEPPKISQISKKLESLNSNQNEDIIFQVLHLTVLKKLWQRSSQDNRDAILTSNDCSDIGFNRFPDINVSKQKTNKNDDSNLKKANKICQLYSIQQIVPYITKDILAETLYNLKLLMPSKFNNNLKIICKHLSNSDKLLLKKDEYKDFITLNQPTSTVEEFSNWLGEIAKEAQNNNSNLAEDDQKNKKQAEDMAKLFEQQKKITLKNYKENAEKLKKTFEKQFSKNAAAGITKPILVPGESNIEIIKEDNKYFCKLIKDKTQKFPQINAYGYSDKEIKEISKEDVSSTQNHMKEVYESGQSSGSSNDVPDSLYPGYIIKKSDDGKYFYIMNDSFKESYENYVKKSKNKDPEFTQEQLKSIYIANNHNLAASSMIMKAYNGSNGPDFIGGMASGDNSSQPKKKILENENLCTPNTPEENEFSYKNVVKIGDKYTLVPEKNFTAGIDEAIYSALQPLGEDNLPVPAPNKPGTILFKDANGNISDKQIDQITSNDENADSKVTEIFNNINTFSELDNDLSSSEKIDITDAVKGSIKSLYQKKTTDITLIKTLTKDESDAVSHYTGAGYTSYNNCLRQKNCTKVQTKEIEAIISGLKKIRNTNHDPKESQTLFRGSRLPASIIKQLNNPPADGVEIDKGFMSTSGNYSTAAGFSGSYESSPQGGSYILVMKTKSCIGISKMSNFKEEDEFLCPPGMKFRINRKDKNSNTYYIEEISESKKAN